LFTLVLALSTQFSVAEAADTGNVLAGLLGTFMILVVICAGLGWWSRRQSGDTSGEDDYNSTA
jgi:hypothetical protein